MSVDPYLTGEARPTPEPERCRHGRRLYDYKPAAIGADYAPVCTCCQGAFVPTSAADRHVGRCERCR